MYPSESLIGRYTLSLPYFHRLFLEFPFPMAEIESEDEYDLINEVDILCSKIQTAAIPFEAEMDKAIRTSIRAH